MQYSKNISQTLLKATNCFVSNIYSCKKANKWLYRAVCWYLSIFHHSREMAIIKISQKRTYKSKLQLYKAGRTAFEKILLSDTA